jgi:anti-anti-sigma factor
VSEVATTRVASLAFTVDCMQVAGKVNFSSVVALEREGEAWLRGAAPVHCRVNLGAVNHCNSAGTALLLSWRRTAAATGKVLAIEQVPQSLLALIHLGGLDDVLPAISTADNRAKHADG